MSQHCGCVLKYKITLLMISLIVVYLSTNEETHLQAYQVLASLTKVQI